MVLLKQERTSMNMNHSGGLTFDMMMLHELNKGWKFKAADEGEWLPAQVPGCVHTDLIHNGRIADPFYGTNERDLQWIDKKDWEYETSFELPGECVSAEHAELVFEGLDTYAHVELNGVRIVDADNMFRIWKADVRTLLRRTGNVLRVRFRSPIAEDLPKLEQLGYGLPAPNDASEIGGIGGKKLSVFARKAPYHYGWDWGPRFVTSGIWRQVRLECWSGARLTDLYIRQDEVSGEQARLTAVVEIESSSDRTAELRICTGELEWKRTVALEAGSQLVELPLEIDRPQLWWCRGLGEPHLYEFTAELGLEGAPADRKRVRTGLRSAVWRTDADEHGATFHLELNGVPVFCKGANHIPNDSFLTNMTRERYRHEIASAVESNMNMLRVWGGGIYEQADFYELCDEYGIMVWQDFMFACSMYPGDDAFLNNVAVEAEDNVKRLRNHPSVVLWCGNNEIDSAWAHYDEHAGWGWKKEFDPATRKRLWADYEEVFHVILPNAIDAFAPGMFYWPSSPITALTGDRLQHASASATSGDIHYWGVWHASEPFEHYGRYVGRFMSEYGFQSFPEPRTVSTYAEEKDMELESEVMLSHQKNGRGNQLIKEYMEKYMQEPKDFRSFLMMSHVLQAEGIRQAIEAHRRNKPYCMGTLYWQMNDCWPVASWSGMDYYGRWKALHYAARRSFRDQALSIQEQNGRLAFYLISDLRRQPDALRLRLRLFDFAGTLYADDVSTLQAEANTSSLAHTIQTESLLQAAAVDRANLVLHAELLDGDLVVDEKMHYFVPEKQQSLDDPQIRLRELQQPDGSTAWIIESDKLAKQVHLSVEAEGYFSDNFFDLIPGVPRTVQFFARTGALDRPAFAASHPGAIEISSMWDWVV